MSCLNNSMSCRKRCSGCDGYYSKIDREYRAAQEAIEWFSSPWDFFLAMIKHADLFINNNEEFVRVEKVVGEDEVDIYWDDGLLSYPKDEVEEWTAVDFSAYLGMFADLDFVSVMERENKLTFGGNK